MADEERRYRFLRNVYYYGSAAQRSITENLMALVTSGSNTSRGVRFTYNENGTVLVNGTNDGSGSSFSRYETFHLDPGTYRKSPIIGNVGLYVQYQVTSSNWVVLALMDNDYFTITEAISQYPIVARVQVRPNYTANNVLYEPYIYRI